MNGTKKIIAVILGILSLIVGASWVDRIYWQYWDIVPAVVHGKIEVKNANKTVCAGRTLIYTVDIDKKIDSRPKIKRQLVNSYIISYPASEPAAKPLGRQKVTASLPVPSSAELGDWHLRWSAEYPLRHGRVVSVDAESETFWVVDCSKKK